MSEATYKQSAVVLANAAELAKCVAQEVMGNDVADTYNGSPLTNTVLLQVAATEIHNVISKKVGV